MYTAGSTVLFSTVLAMLLITGAAIAAQERVPINAADQLVMEHHAWGALREEYSVADIMVLITLVTHYHRVSMITKSPGFIPRATVG